MRTALDIADRYPEPAGCLRCGRTDADAYVSVSEGRFLCYRCVDLLNKTRRRNARLVRRWERRRRILGWLPRRSRCRWRRPAHVATSTSRSRSLWTWTLGAWRLSFVSRGRPRC